LFANTNDAKNPRWHEDNRKCNGLLCHPANSLQWKNIDKEFSEFGKELRNLRLRLESHDVIPIAKKRMILDILRNQLELDNS